MNKHYKSERGEFFKDTSGYKLRHVKCIHYLSYTDSLSMFRKISQLYPIFRMGVWVAIFFTRFKYMLLFSKVASQG